VNLSDLSGMGFDVDTRNHAEAILVRDFPVPLGELCDALATFTIDDVELIRSGGGEAASTQRLRHALAAQGWPKRNIEIQKLIDGEERGSTTHEIDHVRKTSAGSIALEIEWNNKDPFYDRDLENFQRLHVEGAISVGVIVTRGASLQEQLGNIVHRAAIRYEWQGFEDLEQFGLTPTLRQRTIVNSQIKKGRDFADAWARVFVADKFGTATTHWDKLKQRLERGVGNPCPLLLIGLPANIIIPNT